MKTNHRRANRHHSYLCWRHANNHKRMEEKKFRRSGKLGIKLTEDFDQMLPVNVKEQWSVRYVSWLYLGSNSWISIKGIRVFAHKEKYQQIRKKDSPMIKFIAIMVFSFPVSWFLQGALAMVYRNAANVSGLFFYAGTVFLMYFLFSSKDL